VLSFSGNEVKDDDVSALLGLIDRELLTAASQAVLESSSVALLELVERLSDYGADYRNFARELLLHFRELLLLKVSPDGSTLLGQIVPEERERLLPLAAAFSEEDLLRSFEVLTDLDEELRLAQDPRVSLELALLKLAQMRRLMPFSELVERVERLAGGVPAVATPAAAIPAPAAPRPARSATPPPPAAARPEVAPPAAPAAEAAPDASGGLLGQMVELAQTRPSLMLPLRSAQARLEGDTLFLEISPDFAAFAGLHLDEYRALATKAAGRSLKVQVGAGAAPAAAAPSAEAVTRERLMKEASREPAVQEALDLFGGKVVDVRETK